MRSVADAVAGLRRRVASSRQRLDRLVADVRARLEAREGTARVAYWLSVIGRDLRGFAAPRQRRGAMLADVNLEPSNLCNANCVFCGYQFQERAHEAMSDDMAHAIIDLAKRSGIDHVGFTPVVGEPLVHRRLEDFVRRAAAPPQAVRVGITTNGILLTPARFKALADAGLGDLAVSMTYPDEAEYFDIYRSKKLRTVVANLDAILDAPPTGVHVAIGVRTRRHHDWDQHPLFVKARAAGWAVERNVFFDDWSGRTSEGMNALGLWTRPNRPKRLPCTMTYAGPHFFSDGRATACGCRDLDGRSELALPAEALHADLHAVYTTGPIADLRERFRRGDAPAICQSCRHYNPAYEGEALSTRARQLAADAGAALRSIVGLRAGPASDDPS